MVEEGLRIALGVGVNVGGMIDTSASLDCIVVGSKVDTVFLF